MGSCWLWQPAPGRRQGSGRWRGAGSLPSGHLPCMSAACALVSHERALLSCASGSAGRLCHLSARTLGSSKLLPFPFLKFLKWLDPEAQRHYFACSLTREHSDFYVFYGWSLLWGWSETWISSRWFKFLHITNFLLANFFKTEIVKSHLSSY